jgi:hypothetical protein
MPLLALAVSVVAGAALWVAVIGVVMLIVVEMGG